MAVGFVSYAAYTISVKVVKTRLAVIIMVISAIVSFFVKSPYIFPIILLMAGSITAFKYHQQPKEEKSGFKIRWANFILWIGVLIVAASLGGITRAMPVLLFENFYRNGSLVFGGSSVLVPFMYTEFVLFKNYLSSAEFLTGFAAVQAIPGPVFSFTAYIGALAMRDYGIWGSILGGFVAALGIFLPGTFLIFFLIRIWESLKKYRIIRASLEGISAASSGMVAAAALILFQPIETSFLNLGIVSTTFILLAFTKIPAPFIILAGLLSGLIAGIFV
jgi:chromate transporter